MAQDITQVAVQDAWHGTQCNVPARCFLVAMCLPGVFGGCLPYLKKHATPLECVSTHLFGKSWNVDHLVTCTSPITHAFL